MKFKSPIMEKFTFKAKAMNLEFIDAGTKSEIRPIHVPKKTKINKEPKF